MSRRNTLVFFAGLCAAALVSPAAANCGLSVNPGALDTNDNAALSRAEAYGSPLAPVFDRIDTNRNGAISQQEYANRCYSLQASTNNNAGWNDSVVDKRVQQQQQRQQNRVNNRINRETNEATDGMVDKVMGAIFGD
jgi:hypothetical protein